MTSGVPWDEKDVGQQTRDSAQDAARRSGNSPGSSSVGDWLDAIINDRPKSEPADPAFTPHEDDTGKLASVRGRLDDVTRQLDQLTSLNSNQPFLRPDPGAVEPPRDLASVISRLD